MPPPMTRRDFLKLGAGAAAAAVVPVPSAPVPVPYVLEAATWTLAGSDATVWAYMIRYSDGALVEWKPNEHGG